jgi:hypothetical protein
MVRGIMSSMRRANHTSASTPEPHMASTGPGTFSIFKALQQKTAAELDALLPSILDKAFKGELP